MGRWSERERGYGEMESERKIEIWGDGVREKEDMERWSEREKEELERWIERERGYWEME